MFPNTSQLTLRSQWLVANTGAEQNMFPNLLAFGPYPHPLNTRLLFFIFLSIKYTLFSFSSLLCFPLYDLIGQCERYPFSVIYGPFFPGGLMLRSMLEG